MSVNTVYSLTITPIITSTEVQQNYYILCIMHITILVD